WQAGGLRDREPDQQCLVHLELLEQCLGDGDRRVSSLELDRVHAAPAARLKDPIASSTRSNTSKTVTSLVICSRSITRLLSDANFTLPPAVRAEVYRPTSVPSPPLSM